MSPSVEALCPACKGRIEVPYTLLGAPTACPSCGKFVVPEVLVGTIYPITEYEITLGDFQQLVGNSAYRSAVGALLARWFHYRIDGDGDSTIVRSPAGESLDLIELHRQIQEDPTKQRELYRTAMALWR